MNERMTIDEVENWHNLGINHNEPELWAEYANENIQTLFERIAELETQIKSDCVNFFRWFWNQPGTNAEQGYDKWLASKQEQGDG